VADRWTTAEVLALAPDAAVGFAARGLATPAAWSGLGSDDVGVWGLYRGTSAEPYDVVVDRTGPAWRCSCPSRKLPCKHAIGLLLLWAEGNVPTTVRPEAVSSWLAGRAQRARSEPDGSETPLAPELLARPTGESAVRPESDRSRERRADERAARVRAGLEELDRWLADQVRRGLTAPEVARRESWEDVVARLVDAQAGALANRVRRATDLVAAGSGWHERVLGEMANLHTIAVAGTRLAALDEDLETSVRTMVGWTVAKEDVLAGLPVTDHWHVVGRSDTEEHRITVRRTWLSGRETGRWALLLAFAAFGESLDEYPPVGSVLHADVHFFPGRVPLRAVIGVQHEPATEDRGGPQPSSVAGTVSDAGWALAREPWLERWPGVVLASPAVVRGANAGWTLVDDTGSLPLQPGRGLITLLAVSGGRPVVVAGEHRAGGFAPLSVRVHDRAASLA
jgi:SWIM zinc finger